MSLYDPPAGMFMAKRAEELGSRRGITRPQAGEFGCSSHKNRQRPGEVLSKIGCTNLRANRYGRTAAVRLVIETNGRGSARALPVEVILGYTGSGTRLEVLGWYHAPHP